MIKIRSGMINKKIISGLFILNFLVGCTSPTVMIGPAYTMSSSGSTLQAGLSYGSNKLINQYTGKTPIENLKDISLTKKKELTNIERKTLESEEFYILVKNKIEKTNGILNLTNQ
tara:strand:+ start:113 stop:457 length:345 start_codon:yes stop_codon:yes gene_type:complete